MDIAGQDAELPEIRHRSQVLSLIVTVVFLALGVRLFYLQVIEGDNFYRMTAENIIRTVPLPATRGQIRDRKGRVFATMVPSYDIEVLPSQITRESYDRLRALLGPDVERMLTWEAIEAEATKGKDRTLVAAENVSRDVMAQLETSLDKPGIHVAAVQRRHRRCDSRTRGRSQLDFAAQRVSEVGLCPTELIAGDGKDPLRV